MSSTGSRERLAARMGTVCVLFRYDRSCPGYRDARRCSRQTAQFFIVGLLVGLIWWTDTGNGALAAGSIHHYLPIFSGEVFYPAALTTTGCFSFAASISPRSRAISDRKATFTQTPLSFISKILACLRPKMP